jgi:hypothetical protein
MMAFTAAGSVLDFYKKNIFYGKQVDAKKWQSKIEDIVGGGMFIAQSEAKHKETLDINPRVFHAIIGMATEVTELIEALSTAILEEKPLDLVNLMEELGDYDWYKAILMDELSLNEGEIRATVIAKLQERYPEKFTEEAAINRNVEAERKILEGGA